MKIENLKKVFVALFVGAVLCAVLRDFIMNINIILALVQFVGFIVAVLMIFFHKEIIEEVKKRANECKKECRKIDEKEAAEKDRATNSAVSKVMHKGIPAFLTPTQERQLSQFITEVCIAIGKYDVDKTEPVCKKRQELYHNAFVERQSVPFKVKAKNGNTFIIGARVYPIGFNLKGCVCPEDIKMLDENYEKKPVTQEPVKEKKKRGRRNDRRIKKLRELRKVRKNATGIIINGKEYQRPDLDIAAKQWVLDNKKRVLGYNKVTNNRRLEEKMTKKELFFFVPDVVFPKDNEFRAVVLRKLQDMNIVERYKKTSGGYQILLKKSAYEKVAKRFHEANAPMLSESTEPLRKGYKVGTDGNMSFDARTL